MASGLSKSRLISGWQCGKRLWLEQNSPELLVHSAATEAAFATGHRVGEAAQQQFPGGVLIGHDQQLSAALTETADRLAQHWPVTLFEATFQADGVLIRADVLMHAESGAVRLIEVKASTSVKEYHLQDCAIQLWVLEQLGYNVQQLELAHINNEFVYPGGGDYAGLFIYADVLAQAQRLQPMVPRLVAELRAVLEGPEPEIRMGAQCTNPFDCPFIDYCVIAEQGPPAEMPVSWLPGGWKAAAKLVAEGYRDIRDIPAGHLRNQAAEWCRRVTVSGKPELKPAAAAALKQLEWPRYYFDFETMAPAVPVFAGTRPYKPQAFQWSCHIEHAGGELEHHEFLADGNGSSPAPERSCAEALIKALGTTGPIFMYTDYERRVINTLIERFPDLQPPLAAIADRLYDLYPVTKNNYCHPDMHGSWSIKKVLPTIAPDLSHMDLDIVSTGTDAEVAFLEMLDAATTAERRAALREALLRYCELDTLAMVRLVWFLSGG